MCKPFFAILLSLTASLAQPATVPRDSIQAATGIQWNYAPLLNQPDSLGINIELVAPNAGKGKVPFYNPGSVMPSNPLFLDNRGSSYYVPRQVNDQLTHIMNRPSADAFLPVMAVAFLTARLAMHALEIKKMVQIDTTAYLLNTQTFQILQELWKKSPQTTAQLFRHPALHATRTFTTLQAGLDSLLSAKLIKIKQQEKAPPLYFAAQKGIVVRKMLTEALLRKKWNANQLKQARQLLQLDWGWKQ